MNHKSLIDKLYLIFYINLMLSLLSTLITLDNNQGLVWAFLTAGVMGCNVLGIFTIEQENHKQEEKQ